MLIFGDEIERTWRQIEEFSGAATERIDGPSLHTEQMVELPDIPDVLLEEGEALIRDERGVRIARVEEEAD